MRGLTDKFAVLPRGDTDGKHPTMNNQSLNFPARGAILPETVGAGRDSSGAFFVMRRHDEAVAMYREGKAIREIARTIKCHHTTISRHLKEAGIVLTEEEKQIRLTVRKEIHQRVAISMGAGNRSRLRDSAERCVICLSSIGLGKRVIARTIGIPEAMASNAMKKIGTSAHKRTFRALKSKTQHCKLRRLNQRIARSLRTRVRDSFRVKAGGKNTSARKLIGCTLDEFRVHLESKMTKRMTWENYGTRWHIDHIIPCAKFDLTNPEEISRCFSWSNMRPLCAKKNLSDHARKGLHQQHLLPL